MAITHTHKHTDFLVVQWLRLNATSARHVASILGWRTKIPHAVTKKINNHINTFMLTSKLLLLINLMSQAISILNWLKFRFELMNIRLFTFPIFAPYCGPS